ncbi:transcriptional regulator, TetR family [Limimonas halophila]|uniref:Transcriptional regulator, TetR family n=1 Tax=Limimonas halophila TaxID=1082479 RepID=A0A1G7L7U1_9PROT|nr:TetR/AcrR family transcriptional regulator [Limimonas halophila]SDF45089.1 transcriptional regulator, TetR family [Limimonas halophila]
MASTKRETLVQTAERLFYEEGFHATGIDRIVAEAGVVRMTLYNNFASKDALVAAVLRERQDRFLRQVDEAVAASQPGQTTRALVAAHGEWLRTCGYRGCILVKAMGEFAEHSPAIYAEALAAKNELRGRIADALRADGLAPDGLGERIFLVLEGCNAAVPVLGAEPAAREAATAVDALLTAAGGAEA